MPSRELSDREARVRAYALGYLLRRGHLSNRTYDEALEHGRAVMRLADRRAVRAVPDDRDPDELRRHHELHDPNQPEAA